MRSRSTGSASRVKINREVCLRCGSCEALCPSVFVVKSDGAHVRGVRASQVLCAACLAAAHACPVDAISLK